LNDLIKSKYSIDETARYMLDIFGGEEKQKRDQFISILLFNCVKNIDYETAYKVKFLLIYLIL